MFWCNCAKGYIYPSRRDAVGHSRKIWRVQRKSSSISSASAFNTKNTDILPFSIRWIRKCVLHSNETMSRTHPKVVYLFPRMKLFSWFKRIKNLQGIAICQSTCCRWIVHQSCDSVLTQRCHCVGHSLLRLSSWANGCRNETNIHRVLPPSRHSKHQVDDNRRHLMFINSRRNLFKNCQIFLNSFSVWFFIGEEDNAYLYIFVFLFHSIIKPFWFLSWPNKHHRHK